MDTKTSTAKWIRGLGLWHLVIWLFAGQLFAGQPTEPPAPARPRRPGPMLKIIQLPPPNASGSISLEQALAGQNLDADMAVQPLGVVEIGQLLWATASGLPLVQAGAGLPNLLTAYVVAADGIYRYVPANHSLEQVSAQPMLAGLCTAVIPQAPAAGCGIIISIPSRGRSRVENPARLASFIETGQRIQNLRLQAASLGLAMLVAQQFDGPSMVKSMGLPRDTEVVAVVLVGYRQGQMPTTQPVTTAAPTQPKQVALIVASRGFREEELTQTNAVLTQAGVQTVVASSRVGLLTGMANGVAYATATIPQLNLDQFDAVVFIGGAGAVEFANNPAAHNLAREALAKGKIVGAICIAPTILANAGLVSGKRVTAFPTEQQALIQAGALYTANPVERDGQIITASGPEAATGFGQMILAAISGR